MCDTWVAMKDATADGRVILAKNSDRPIFDCQPLILQPRRSWTGGSKIKTGTIEIPQAEETFAHLGSSPYWCWGYEEGINEWGVVIGNEAIYTRALREELTAFQQGEKVQLGLLGMDLIRLALERSRTAHQAVKLIGSLVEEYGQFGSGVPGKPHDLGSYDNAFMIADPQEAWILETAGKRWAARHLPRGCASISNEPGIRSEWHLGSPDLVQHAQEKGWWRLDLREGRSMPFDFALAYHDEKTSRQVSHMRVMRSRQLLEERRGQITPQWMMRIARDHYEDTFLGGPLFDAANPDFLSLCMHVSEADFTWGNTASSCVAVLPNAEGGLPVFWWTPGPPCNGCYVPFFPHSSRLPGIVSKAGKLGKRVIAADQAEADTFREDSYWWLFSELNDRVKGGRMSSLPGCYQARNPRVREKFDALEAEFTGQIAEVMKVAVETREKDRDGAAKILDEFSARCVARVWAALKELVAELPQVEE